MKTFNDSFWNREICSFQGFDVALKRVKEGRRVLKEYGEFLKQWATAQEVYGKTLVKIAKSAGGKEEIGIMKQAWEVMKSQTEAIGSAYLHSSGQLYSEASKVSEAVEKLKEQRKKEEDEVKAFQNSLRTSLKKMVEARRNYDSRCREKEQAQLHLSKSVDNNVKELQKANQKFAKAEQGQTASEEAFRLSISNFEDVRKGWDCRTESCFSRFQKFEEQRLTSMQNSMWILTNIGSQLCVTEDGLYETMRRALEKCNTTLDIENFINQNATGSARPVPITFETFDEASHIYKADQNSNSEIGIKLASKIPFLTRPIVVEQVSRDESKDDCTVTCVGRSEDIVKDNDFYEYVTLPVAESSGSDDSRGIMRCNSMYESVQKSSQPEAPASPVGLDESFGDTLRVLYTYEARDSTDLSLQEGELVTLLLRSNSEWWQVETSAGKVGYFPANYLGPVK